MTDWLRLRWRRWWQRPCSPVPAVTPPLTLTSMMLWLLVGTATVTVTGMKWGVVTPNTGDGTGDIKSFWMATPLPPAAAASGSNSTMLVAFTQGAVDVTVQMFDPISHSWGGSPPTADFPHTMVIVPSATSLIVSPTLDPELSWAYGFMFIGAAGGIAPGSTQAVYRYGLDTVSWNPEPGMTLIGPTDSATGIGIDFLSYYNRSHMLTVCTASMQLILVTIPELSSVRDNTGVWNAVWWVTTSGARPIADIMAAYVFDSIGHRIFQCGGVTPNLQGSNHLTILDLETMNWNSAPPAPESHCGGHQLFVAGTAGTASTASTTQVIIAGGFTACVPGGDGDMFLQLSVFRLDTMNWAITSTNTRFPSVYTDQSASVPLGLAYAQPDGCGVVTAKLFTIISVPDLINPGNDALTYTVEVALPIPIDSNTPTGVGVANWEYTVFGNATRGPHSGRGGVRLMTFTPLTQYTVPTTKAILIGGAAISQSRLHEVYNQSYVCDFMAMNCDSNPVVWNGPDQLPVIALHTATLMPDDHTIYVYGGCIPTGGFVCYSDTLRSDMWRLDTELWTVQLIPPSPQSTISPPPLAGHSTVLLPDGHTLLLLGGITAPYHLAALPTFDTRTSIWSTRYTTIDSAQIPCTIGAYYDSRQYASAFLIGVSVYVLGGALDFSSGVIELDTRTNIWTCHEPLPSGSAPSLIIAGTPIAAIGSKIVVNSVASDFGTVYVYDTISNTWGSYAVMPADVSLSTGTRFGAALTVGSRIVYLGGSILSHSFLNVLNTGLRNVAFRRTGYKGVDSRNRAPNDLGCVATNAWSIPCEHLSTAYSQFSIPYSVKFAPVQAGAFLHAGVSTDYDVSGFGIMSTHGAYPLAELDPGPFAIGIPIVIRGNNLAQAATGSLRPHLTQQVVFDCGGDGVPTVFSDLGCLTLDGGINPSGDQTLLSDIGLIHSNNGAIVIHEADLPLVLTRMSIVNHTAALQSGTGVSTVPSTHLTIHDCLFQNLTAAEDGGAIQMSLSSTLIITDSIFRDTHCVGTPCTGGAVDATGASVHVERSVFDGCSATVNGGAVSVYYGTANFLNSSFLNCWAETGNGGAIFGAGTSSVSVLLHSTIRGCESRGGSGGAVSVTASSLLVSDTVLSQNVARVGGGGALAGDTGSQIVVGPYVLFSANVALTSDRAKGGAAIFTADNANSIVDFTAIFEYNSCPACGGGVVYWTVGGDIDFRAAIANPNTNTALYGPIFATNIYALRFVNRSATEQLQISGQSITPPLIVRAVDYYENTVLNDHATTVILSPFSSVSGANVVVAVNGTCTFISAITALTPGQTGNISFLSTSGLNNLDPVVITAGLCAPGQYNSIITGTCVPCPAGSWSLNGAATSCIPCAIGTASSIIGLSAPCPRCDAGSVAPEPGTVQCRHCTNGLAALSASEDCFTCGDGVTCVTGSAAVEPDHWLPVDGLIAGQVLNAISCPPDHCLGSGEITGNANSTRVNLCTANRASGDTNPLCGRCVTEYSEWGNQCLRCADGANGGIVFGVLLLSAIVTTILYHLSQDTSDSTVQSILYFVSTFRLLVTSQKSWLQWLGFFDFSPSSVTANCPLTISPLQSLVLSIVAPLIYLGWLLAAAVVHAGISKCTTQRRCSGCNCCNDLLSAKYQCQTRRYMRAAIAILISSYTTITAALFASLDCTPTHAHAPSAGSVVYTFPAVECDSDSAYHKLLPFVYCMIVLITGGVPAGMIAIVVLARRRRQQLNAAAAIDSDKTLSWFKSVYAVYQTEFDWWSVFAILRRTILVSIGLALSQNSFDRLRVQIISCLIFLLLHMLVNPLRSARDNRFESATLIGLVLIGLLSISANNNRSESLPVPAQVIVSMIVLSIGGVFVCIKITPIMKPRIRQCCQCCQCWSYVSGIGVAAPHPAVSQLPAVGAAASESDALPMQSINAASANGDADAVADAGGDASYSKMDDP